MRQITLGAILILALDGPATAGPPTATVSPTYAMTEIRASGILPMRGVHHGIVFQQSLDRQCKPLPGAFSHPIAAKVGGNIHLEISLGGCPTPREEPRFPCTARTQWSPQNGLGVAPGPNVDIVVPNLTGVYQLKLSCHVEGADKPVTRMLDLYVTFDDPMPIVLGPHLPKALWYERAAAFATGFGADAGRELVVAALTRSIYRYGHKHWKYGYGRFDEKTHGFTFNGKQVLTAKRVEKFGVRANGTCPWQFIIKPGSPCNFGDCYIFSNVLHNLANVMGIGGLRERVIRGLGKGNQGFALPAGRVSLDPDFPGNVLCKPPCPPYVFSSHSVQWHGQTFFDPTFNVTFSRPSEAATLSIDKWHQKIERKVTFSDTSQFMCILPQGGYGSWLFYQEPSQDKSCQANVGKKALFQGKPKVTPRDMNDDSYSEALAVTMDVQVLRRGRYVVAGAILTQGGDIITFRPSWDSASFAADHIPRDPDKAASPQRYQAHLRFSGEDIRRHREEARQIVLFLAGSDGIIEKKTFPLNPIKSDRFSEVGATIASFGTPEKSGEGARANWKAQVDLDIRTHDKYLIAASLGTSEGYFAHTAQSLQLGDKSDASSIDLTFPPDEVMEGLATAGVHAPSHALVILYDEHLDQIDVWEGTLPGVDK